MHVNPEAAKSKTLWPLPGGSGHYLATLSWVVEQVEGTTRKADVLGRMVERFGLSSHKAADSYLRVPHTLGLIEIVGQSVYLTDVGLDYLHNPSREVVRDMLNTRISGCTDIAAALDGRPRRIGPLTAMMRELGHHWSTNSQVRYRLRWLEEVGVVERLGGTRQTEYRITTP